jgi:hypothetical protein
MLEDCEISINVPVVFMARYVLVLRGALEGVGPENQDFFGFALANSGPKKVSIFRAHPFQ